MFKINVKRVIERTEEVEVDISVLFCPFCGEQKVLRTPATDDNEGHTKGFYCTSCCDHFGLYEGSHEESPEYREFFERMKNKS